MKKTKQIALAAALTLFALCPTVFGQIMGDTQFTPDNAFDIGKSASGRPRTIYIGTSLVTPSITLNGVTATAFGGNGLAISPLTLQVTGTTAGAVNLGDGAYAQGTSNATTVVAPAASGVITSFGSFVNAANTSVSFTVTCTACAATSAVQVSVVSYGGTLGTNGCPVVTVSSVGAGSFVINVTNPSANALNGNLKIAYAVL